MAAAGFDVGRRATPGRSTSSRPRCAAATGDSRHEPARLPPRSLRRGRRRAADEAASSSSSGSASACAGGRDLQGAHAGVAPGRRVLDRHEHVRQRLVAGGLRRRPRLRRPRRADRRAVATRSSTTCVTPTSSRRRAAARPGRRTRSSRSASSPVANAAWQWELGVRLDVRRASELMQQFVSAQVYALRNHSVRTGLPSDHWGFAWAPRNARVAPRCGLRAARRAPCSTGSRRRSATPRPTTPADPGVRACGPSGTEPVVRRRPRGRDASPTSGAPSDLVADDARVRRDAAARSSARAPSPAPIGLQAQVAGVPAQAARRRWSRRSARRRRPGRSRRARPARSRRR